MDLGEQTTGTRDEHYNLIAVLYHALHGAENCDIYAVDAEAGGRIDLADFFREAQAMQRQLADDAKELLGIGGTVPAGGATIESDAPPGAAPMQDVPRATDVPSGAALALSGGVPPGPEGVAPTGAAPGAGGVEPGTTSLERNIPPGTAPEDVPPRSTDVQREAQVRADEVGAPAEGIPQTTDVPRTPPDAVPEEDIVAEPTERSVGEDVPPREGDVLTEAPAPADSPRAEDVPRTGEVPPSPSEPPPPDEEPLEAERRTESGEYFSNIIRETDRRSRGRL